jgi:hypothetical protein
MDLDKEYWYLLSYDKILHQNDKDLTCERYIYLGSYLAQSYIVHQHLWEL